MVDPETVKTVATGAAALASSKALVAIAEGGVKAAEAVWTSLLKRAADEVGLALQERIKDWRLRNFVTVSKKIESRAAAQGIDVKDVQLHPRLGIAILEQSSLNDDDVLQEMWAGLVVSSADADGQDDSILLLVDLLSKLTRVQARLLKHACERAKVACPGPAGLLHVDQHVRVSVAELVDMTGITDIQRLDRELDHLRNLGLLSENSGFSFGGAYGAETAKAVAEITAAFDPSPLGLHLYAHCNGAKDPSKFHNIDSAPGVKKE